jgi:prepilin-type N-terminal cleavage/methylation domain
MNRKRKAFTLIELLMVIAIIAIISAGSIAMAKWRSDKQSLTAAQQTLMSAFEEARLMAISKNARSRVVIYKGDDPGRKLRQVGVLYEAFDEFGKNMGWIASGMPVNLPKNTFFIPPSGEFRSHIKFGALTGESATSSDDDIDPESALGKMKASEVIYSTFNSGTTGAPSVVGIDEFSIRPRSMGEGNGEWYCYEFSPEGLSENPSAVIVLGIGTPVYESKIGPDSIEGYKHKIVMDNPYDIMGFVVYRQGRIAAFTEYDQIDGNVREK